MTLSNPFVSLGLLFLIGLCWALVIRDKGEGVWTAVKIALAIVAGLLVLGLLMHLLDPGGNANPEGL